MIHIQQLQQECTRVVVKANQSMSWRANVLLALSLGVVCLGIAGVMASQGFWMIIPFAGAEVLFVLFCLYSTVRRLGQQEVITIEPQEILLEWGYREPETSVNLPRHWSKLNYRCSDNEFETGDLSLSAYGKRYSLGNSLGRDEKRTLYTKLRQLL
jgi:uncharacterized membrane protein